MIRSMTGYGRARAEKDGAAFACEVRSVNARGREVRVRLPSDLASLEPTLRERVQESVARGRVDVFIDWERGAASRPRPVLNPDAAAAVVEAWRRLEKEHGLEDPPQIAVILRVPGVMEAPAADAPDLEALAALALEALDTALEAHGASRTREGGELARDIGARVQRIAALVDELRGLTAAEPQRVAATLRERVRTLLGETPLDEARLAQEIALLAQRADVTEEIVRLDAHLARFNGLFAKGAVEIGRTCDFLVQEVRREVSTLGAKSGTPDVDARVLAIKSELERIREQALNLE